MINVCTYKKNKNITNDSRIDNARANKFKNPISFVMCTRCRDYRYCYYYCVMCLLLFEFLKRRSR